MVGEGNNLKPKAIRILESYIKSIFTLVQIQYAEQPEGRVVRIPPPQQNSYKVANLYGRSLKDSQAVIRIYSAQK